MKNFTGGEKPQTITELYCSVEFTREVHGELVFLSVINTFSSITAFLGNTLILFALRKDTSIHPPSKLLYRNLAITDFLCWRHRRTCVCYILDVSGDGTVESLSNHLGQICYNW